MQAQVRCSARVGEGVAHPRGPCMRGRVNSRRFLNYSAKWRLYAGRTRAVSDDKDSLDVQTGGTVLYVSIRSRTHSVSGQFREDKDSLK
jgi:hypothetical protein